MYDLNFVLLPKDKINIKKSFLQNFPKLILKTRNNKTEETVADMMEELKNECLVNQVLVVECKACENNSVSNEADNNQEFEVHTHSDQYQVYTFHLKNYEMDKQARGTSAGALDEAK